VDKDASSSPTTQVRSTFLRFWEKVLVLVVFVALFLRLLILTARYAVNIFFMDQWDFNEATLFQKHSLWEMFRWQHGPHRQGLGAVVAFLIEPLFQWNSHAESFLVLVIVLVAAFSALLLKKRLFGFIGVFDVVIPLIFLTPLQFETLFVTANLAHGPLPVLLVVVYCLAWTIRSRAGRYSSALLLNFVAIHTGFGLFLGLITPVALVADYLLNLSRESKGGLFFALALSLSVLSLGLFFFHYSFDTSVDCAPNAFQSPASYVRFACLMLANVVGAKGLGFIALFVGALLLASMLVALALCARSLLRQPATNRTKTWSASILLAFCLLFVANAAYGRSCLGPDVAQVSRYVIYMELGPLGLYFFVSSLPNSTLRIALSLFLCAALLAAIPIRKEDAAVMRFVSTAKRNWKACYLQVEDIRTCNHVVGYGVYPDMTHNFAGKLEFLKQKKLNFYAALH
jgi:hypothetical protein